MRASYRIQRAKHQGARDVIHMYTVWRERERPKCERKRERSNSRVAVGFLVVAFVVLHVQGHLTDLAVETSFMPVLQTTHTHTHTESHINIGFDESCFWKITFRQILISRATYLVFLKLSDTSPGFPQHMELFSWRWFSCYQVTWVWSLVML